MYKRTGQIDLLGLMRIVEWYSKTQITIKANTFKIGDYFWDLESDTVLAVADILDTGSISNGKDYYVYACNNAGTLVFKVSLNSTYPSGFDANTSRKIGGFHTLCANVGTISGHPLSGYVANDILPASVWDLNHRPVCEPAGMVYVDAIDKWVDIYLASGTGASTASVFGGTISDNRNWMDFVDDGAAVLKQLLSDPEFQIAAALSNEGTNIAGSADPVTTGGHSDTASRRMISKYGIEDMCGAMWQWLRDNGYRADGADLAALIAFSWKDQTGGKGQLYTQGTYGDVKPRAGGGWYDATYCGSRGRSSDSCRWGAASGVGGRFRSEPKKSRT